MNIKKLTSSKRFRYGSVSAAFSAVFIAVVLVLNIILSALSRNYPLYADMTKEELYTVSDATRQQLSGIDSDVKIIFFVKKDTISKSSYLGYVNSLAEEYEKNFDFIKVEYIDLISHPTAANKYKVTSSDVIKTDTVVVSCPESAKSRIIQLAGFYTFMQDSNGNTSGTPYAFNGEKRFTANILQVTGSEKPTAYFTVGHDESTSSKLYSLLADEGYEVGTVDLARGEVPEGASFLIISNPMRDFAGLAAENNGGKNEIRALNDYMMNKYGSVIVLLSPSTPELPELSEYLAEWGITYEAGSEVLHDSAANTIDTDGVQIIASYCGDADSYEYQLHKSVSSGGSSAKTICAYNIPLTLSKVSNKYTAPVLKASGNAFIRNGDGKTEMPEACLAALSYYGRYVDNEEKRANMLVFGSPYFFDSAYVSTSSYGNAEILYGAMKLFGNSSVSVDIPAKPFVNNEMDITNKSATTCTVILCGAIPLVILAFGILLWLRRKNK